MYCRRKYGGNRGGGVDDEECEVVEVVWVVKEVVEMGAGLVVVGWVGGEGLVEQMQEGFWGGIHEGSCGVRVRMDGLK